MRDPSPAFTRCVGYGLLVLLTILVFWPFFAPAKLAGIAESQGGRITLTDEPCKSPVLAQVKPEYQPNFRASSYYVGKQRQTVKGCYWLVEGQYLTIWEDGDIFALPPSLF